MLLVVQLVPVNTYVGCADKTFSSSSFLIKKKITSCRLKAENKNFCDSFDVTRRKKRSKNFFLPFEVDAKHTRKLDLKRPFGRSLWKVESRNGALASRNQREKKRDFPCLLSYLVVLNPSSNR